MLVLNTVGSIERICLSKKLGLYLANLPNDMQNDWNSGVFEEFKVALAHDAVKHSAFGLEKEPVLRNAFERCCPDMADSGEYDDEEMLHGIVDRMVYLGQEYRYEDMPLGGWETNCFDGRFCEEEYAEKIVDLINFLKGGNELGQPAVQVLWVYSSNYDSCQAYRLAWMSPLNDEVVDWLRHWGGLFDTFLQSREDYLLFDYLVNMLHRDNEHNMVHLMKSYSLCQLFLEQEGSDNEGLDCRLAQFLPGGANETEKCTRAAALRRMRNKIAHGDFSAFERLTEEYAQGFLDGRFCFDYSELSRKNWVIQDACCQLDDAVRGLIWLLFNDREELQRIQQSGRN